MSCKRVTIIDLARALGVFTYTVSRAAHVHRKVGAFRGDRWLGW
jgi:hypothetical protein